MNQHDALYKAARNYPGGVEALAKRMGISAAVLYSKLRPGCDTHHVSFEQVSEITDHLVEARVPNALQALQALTWRHGMVAISLPPLSEQETDCLVQSICKSVVEFGHLTSAVSEAMADGKICGKEWDEIDREFSHAIGALTELRERIRAKVTVKADK
ncbi:phage regulatory CII family protein [Oxalicibacterium faecigallinarum]|nr:phage regulatory CII family protein [Oxalicibacterium faecigallinarum]